MLDDGIVHNDFHHRNFLAIGSDVTEVFDWELANVGARRYDLATLAWWSLLMPAAAAKLAVDRLHETCEPDVLALFAAVRSVIQLDFDARNYAILAGPSSNGLKPMWHRGGEQHVSLCPFPCGRTIASSRTASTPGRF